MAARPSSASSSKARPSSSAASSSTSSSSAGGGGGRISASAFDARCSPSSSSVSSHPFAPLSVADLTRSVSPSISSAPPMSIEAAMATNEFVDEVSEPSGPGESISVTVRFRPLSQREYQRGDEVAWYADGDKIVRSEYNPATFYAFDKVFDDATSTLEVYNVAARPVVKAAMEGINGTVFAYGVTSSGKTHTMHGDSRSPGIIPMAIKDVFNIIQDTPGREFLLRVSYLEIYNEVINDLLDPTGQNLRVREDAQGTYVEGIKEEVVLSPGHVLSFIAAGEEHRHVGSNNFNLFSSRSHTIFTLMIESSGHGDEYDGAMYSQLNLIDLAGSESSKTDTTGLRRKEGSYINKSLLTLGTVIGKLSEGKATHIPYRDSKLTRLLQSSLSGHGLVSLICTVTPASSNMEETHNTLKFASRAKRIEIYASRNRIIDEKSLIKKYQKEISSLKQELEQMKKGMLYGEHMKKGMFYGVNQEEVISLRQQLEEGQIKMQSRLEEEEEAKAALMSRIQRLTRLILVSTKNMIPGKSTNLSSHRRCVSLGECDYRKLDLLRDTPGKFPEAASVARGSTDSAIPDQLDPLSRHRMSSRISPEEHSKAEDEMDLLTEQVKMLAGEIAFSSSNLKRVVDQSAHDLDANKDQIQNLENEIQEKQRQMRFLEQKISETGRSSLDTASIVDMQQTIRRLMSLCSDTGFELELKAADNRILQEQLQQKSSEIKEWQEKALLHQPLNSAENGKIHGEFFSEEQEQLKHKIRFLEAENEKLKFEKIQFIEEKHGLVIQNQKLAEEASYAKELASSAAVELKNLAEEVTKLSLQNARQAKELLAANGLAYSKASNGAIWKSAESNNDCNNMGRKTSHSNRGSEVGTTGYTDGDNWCADEDGMDVTFRKQRESTLLAEKGVLEEEYKRKLDEAKKREVALENELAGMWVLVAKLKRNALSTSELKADKQFNSGDDVNDIQEINEEFSNSLIKERQMSNGFAKANSKDDQINQNAELEPLLVQLKARIQEMKEKEQDSSGTPDVNSHVCKVCFEASTVAVLLPCRHFCLCKPCSLACSECPVCRTKIDDRIIAFTS